MRTKATSLECNNQICGSERKQFEKKIFDDIPPLLASTVMEFMDIDQEISRIVNESLFFNTDGAEMNKKPDASKVEALVKRKKYQVNKFVNDIMDDYHYALKNEMEKVHPCSPFGIMAIGALTVGRHMDHETAVSCIYETLAQYLKDLKKSNRIGSGKEFVGFYQYMFFRNYVNNPKYAIKLLRIDLEECIYRLAFTREYESYRMRTALRFSYGTIEEKSSFNDQDAEQESSISELLKNAFFPGEPGIEKVAYVGGKDWDDRDFRIFSALCTKAIERGFTRDGMLNVDGNLMELTHIAFPEIKSLSSRHYMMMAKRLVNIVSTAIVVKKENGAVIQKSLFDQSILKFEDGKQVEITNGISVVDDQQKSLNIIYNLLFGNSVTMDILANCVATITKNGSDVLDSEVAKMFYVQMKKERLADMVFYKKPYREYTLISFTMIYRAKERLKADRIRRYVETLQEMKDHGVLIEDFKVRGDEFYVTWIPLSEEEVSSIKVIDDPESKNVLYSNNI